MIYSSGKNALYERKMILITMLYCAAVIIASVALFQPSFKVFNTDGIFYVYLSIMFFYFVSKLIETKFYGRKILTRVQKFLFFKTKYNFDVLGDIIKNNIRGIEEINDFDIYFEANKGLIVDLGNYLCLSLISKDGYLSVAISKESGKYIFQDKETMKIQEKVGFVFKEVLNFKDP